MTELELMNYAKGSMYPFHIINKLYNTLHEELRTAYFMQGLEEVAKAHNVDIIELAEQSNQSIGGLFTHAIGADKYAHPKGVLLKGELDPFMAN